MGKEFIFAVDDTVPVEYILTNRGWLLKIKLKKNC
jgi:hypothetical protein